MNVLRLALRPETAYRLFYPQVPAILCAKSRAIAATPVVSAFSISNSPPRVAISISKNSKTHAILKNAQILSLNWLPFKKRSFVSGLAESTRKKDKLRTKGIPYSMIMGAPVLKDSEAYLIASKERVINVGDHDLFICRVLGAIASLDFDEYWKFEDYHPILYVGSSRRKKFETV